MQTTDLQVNIELAVEIRAQRERVWRAIIEDWGRWFIGPEGVDMKMRLEPRVGGRLFRDLGDGVGHLWGHVQVIKPPGLLEIIGPLAVSYPSVSHVTFRLEEAGPEQPGPEESEQRTRLRLTHRGVGYFPEGMAAGFAEGWPQLLEEIKSHVE